MTWIGVANCYDDYYFIVLWHAQILPGPRPVEPPQSELMTQLRINEAFALAEWLKTITKFAA
jgi:hypothetical protein